MTAFRRNMLQEATYWPPPVHGLTGDQVFQDGQRVVCRWEDKNILSLTAAGEEFTSLAIVYVGAEIKAGGFLALNEERGAPRPIEEAQEIRALNKSPRRDGLQALYKAII